MYNIYSIHILHQHTITICSDKHYILHRLVQFVDYNTDLSFTKHSTRYIAVLATLKKTFINDDLSQQRSSVQNTADQLIPVDL